MIRRDLQAFLKRFHRRHTIAAARRLHTFTRPVLLAWASEDTLFPISLAERLDAVLPAATISRIDDSFTFVPEDQPVMLSQLITRFAGNNATA